MMTRYLWPCLISLALAVAALADVTHAPAISYTLATPSSVSIAIYTPQGAIIRQLLLGAARGAGQHTEEWNGLDDSGKPVPAGAYRWKLLSSQGLHAEWITSLGSGLTPGYQIMPGNHVGAMAIAQDAQQNCFVMGGCSECVPGMAKISAAGKVLWYSNDLIDNDNDGGVGIANGIMFTLLRNARVIAVDPATGKGLWKAETNWSLENKGGYFPIGALSLAARGDQLLIANKSKNLVCWLDTANGKILEQATVPAPQALAFDRAGNVLAISGAAIVQFSRRDKTPRTLLSGLDAPYRLDVDPRNGDLLVAEQGAKQQITRYSAEGTLLASYGRKGGRLFGKYAPRDFRGVTALCAQRDGGFIVIEGYAAPRRTAFFDAHGTLRREWYGGLAYANGGCGDPADPSIVWYHSGSGEVVRARVDFIKKSYTVLETYKLIGIGDGIISAGNSMDIFMVRHFRGHTYLVSQLIEPRVVMVDAAHRQLVPVVAGKYFMQHDFANPTYTPTAFARAYNALPAKTEKEAVIWTDLHGDGTPRPEEMIFSRRMLMTWSCGRIWADAHMNLYEMNDRPMIWRPKGWTKAGAPIYGGWADWQPLGQAPTTFDPLKVSWPAGSGVAPLSDGSLLGFANSTENPFGKGIGSDGLGGNYILKWDQTGKLVWVTGFHSPDFGAAPGEGRFLWNIAGTPHDCMVVTDMQCYFTIKNLVYVWDKDGLWVGRLFDHPDLKAAPEDAYTLATENFGGTLQEVTAKNKAPGLAVGDVVFYGCGQNVTGVYRITGWDTFRRAQGDVTVTPTQVDAAQQAAFLLAAQKSMAGKHSRVKKNVSAFLPRFTTPPVLDGKLDDPAWAQAGILDDFRLMPAEEDAAPTASSVRAGYDENNLYLAVHCSEPNLDKLRVVGSPVYQDDCMEVFLDRDCDRTHYYHFMINANGVYEVGYGWAARPEVKITTCAGREGNAWIVEAAIPWKNLGTTAPKDGDKLGFQVVRNRHAGLEQYSNWSPLYGNLNHSPQYFGTLYAGSALPREAQALVAGRAFVHHLGNTPVTLDGSLTPWHGIKPLKLLDGTKPVADVYLGWQADSLYAAFDVTTDKPWKNNAALDMAFNGGAGCDLQLGPLQAGQKDVLAGDVRFLAAPLKGQDDVVEFLPKLTTDLSEADRAPRSYHTEAQGDNAFDRLALLPHGSVVVKAKTDGHGYIVEMKVPLRAPLKLASGLRFKFDASVILSNTAGNRAELRLPLFSTSSDDMFVASDVVMETRLRPWNWGEAELE